MSRAFTASLFGAVLLWSAALRANGEDSPAAPEERPPSETDTDTPPNAEAIEEQAPTPEPTPQAAPISCDEAPKLKGCLAACREKFKKPTDDRRRAEQERLALADARRLPRHAWIAIGLGGALIAGGVVTGALALDLNSDLEGACDDGACPPSRHDDLDRRDNLAISSSVLLGTGIAVSITGILILAIFAPAPVEVEDETAWAPTLSPLLGRETAGAALGWRF